MDTKNISKEIFKQYCKLCGDITSSDDVKIIDDVMKNIFNVLLLNLTFEDETQHVLCRVCSSKIMAALNFKSTCIYTDNFIIPFVDSKYPALVDLKEVYAKKEGSDQANSMVDDQKICRLCLKPISGEVRSLHDLPLGSVKILIPEVNFRVTADPRFCTNCLDSLSVHSTFLKMCSDLKQEMDTIENDDGDTCLIEACIKTEEIEIKCEENKVSDYTPPHNPISEPGKKIKSDANPDKCKKTTLSSTVLKSRCTKCHYETTCTEQFTQHMSQHNIILKLQAEDGRHENLGEKKCDIKKKNGQPKCQDASKSRTQGNAIYSCQTKCGYETEHMRDLVVHELTHKNLSESGIYLCQKCNRQFRNRRNFIKHLLLHNDLLEGHTYRCQKCGFRRHTLVHMDRSEVKMYKCDTCKYEFKLKPHLETHMLRHKDPSEVKMYKCEECNFETKYKRHLPVHQKTHKVVFKCEECTYETKQKRSFKRHIALHKRSPEELLYKCNECIYGTRNKNRLKLHMLSHRDPSEVQMYKCYNCKYETKYRKNLILHLVMHRDPSEVKKYKCEECDFKTRYRNRLPLHEETHKRNVKKKNTLQNSDVTNV